MWFDFLIGSQRGVLWYFTDLITPNLPFGAAPQGFGVARLRRDGVETCC